MAGCGGGSSDSPSIANQSNGEPPTSVPAAPAPSAESTGQADPTRAGTAKPGDAQRASKDEAKSSPSGKPGNGVISLPADSPAGRRYLRKLTQGIAANANGSDVEKQLAEVLAKAKRGEFAVPGSSAGSASEYAEEVLQKVAEGKIGQ